MIDADYKDKDLEFDTNNMTLIDQEIRVIRSIDLAWRPRGAINRTPDETEKQTKNTLIYGSRLDDGNMIVGCAV